MIDDKKIEEAATVASISDTEKGSVREGYIISALADHENGFREGYIEGVKWAIDEFLKDLWHHVSERPRRNTTYLVQIRDCIFETFYDSEEWKFFVKGCNITRWLYIDDLLLKKGGKQ